MGRFYIETNLGSGLYYGYPITNTARIDLYIAAINEQITRLNDDLPGIQAQYDAAAIEANTAASEYLALVNSLADIDGASAEQIKEVNDKYAAVVKARKKRDGFLYSLNVNKISVADKEKQVADFTAAKQPRYREAWCSEFYEGFISGDIAYSAELDQDNYNIILLAPNSISFNGYPVGFDDKRLQPTQNSMHWTSLYNRILLSAVQKHKPTFKQGRILSINTSADTCSIIFDNIKGDKGTLANNIKLSVNETGLTFNNVPIHYLDCNSEGFEVGDVVLVQFQTQAWENPKVIGFISNPRECPDTGGGFIPVHWYATVGTIYYTQSGNTHYDEYLTFQHKSGLTYYYYLDHGERTGTVAADANEKVATFATGGPLASRLITVVSKTSTTNPVVYYSRPLNDPATITEANTTTTTRTITFRSGGVDIHTLTLVETDKSDFTAEQTAAGVWTSITQNPLPDANEIITYIVLNVDYWRDSYGVWTLDYRLVKRTDTKTYYVNTASNRIDVTINRTDEYYVLRVTETGETIYPQSTSTAVLTGTNVVSIPLEFVGTTTDEGTSWHRITDIPFSGLYQQTTGPLLLTVEPTYTPPPTY